MDAFDTIVLGGGVIGTSIAAHLAMLGAGRVALLERATLGGGTTAQSSCILRTHYSVPENVALAHAAIGIFARLPEYLDDPEAASGFNRCGLMIVAPARRTRRRRSSRDASPSSASLGIDAREIARDDARALPSAAPARRHRARSAGSPTPATPMRYLTLSCVRAQCAPARCVIREGVAVTGTHARRRGPRHRRAHRRRATSHAGTRDQRAEHLDRRARALDRHRASARAVAPRGVHARRRRALHDATCPVHQGPRVRRQALLAELRRRASCSSATATRARRSPRPTPSRPTFRSTTSSSIGAQVAHRAAAFADAGLAASWTGVYDVTPDWNPGAGPDRRRRRDCRSPTAFPGTASSSRRSSGRLLAQSALGLPTDLPLAPYALERFAAGRLLHGPLRRGAVS